MSKEQVFEVDIKCSACRGTGLYVGFCERDGSAVVCYKCNGSGKFHHKLAYELFTERIRRDDVKRVFLQTCGYVHSAEDHEGIEFSKGGTSYKDWLEGGDPKPIKSLYCPLLWTNQRWKTDKCLWGGRISQCKHWENKAKCWEEYEKEQGV